MKLPRPGLEDNLSRLVWTEKDQGFLMGCIPVASGRFHDILRAVGLEAPGDFFAIAIVGDGDIQDVDTFVLYICK
jgi:hypothetical protein